jgi:hypothetical protein
MFMLFRGCQGIAVNGLEKKERKMVGVNALCQWYLTFFGVEPLYEPKQSRANPATPRYRKAQRAKTASSEP